MTVFWRELKNRTERSVFIRRVNVRGRSQAGVYSTDSHRVNPTHPEPSLNAQRFGVYGIASECPDGTESIVLAIGGPTNLVSVAELPQGAPELEPGEVCIWAKAGQRVLLNKDGDVIVLPAEGRGVHLGGNLGTTDQVVTRAELNTQLSLIASHTHPETGTTTGASAALADLSVDGSPNVSAKT